MSDNTPQPAPESNGRRGLPRPMVVGILAVLAAGGLGFWWHSQGSVSTDDAQVDGHLAPVASRVPGSVEQVMVQDNQAVKAGDVLVQIDARDQQARVDQAKAALAQAEAAVETAKSDLQRAKVAYDQASGADLQGAQATLDARKASYEKARTDVTRMKPLAERQEISALQFDGVRTTADVAENEFKAAQRKLNSLHHEADMRKVGIANQQSRLAQAEAQVAAARANLSALELQLGYTRVTAAIDGVVTRKLVEVGQTLSPGQNLMTLVPLHQTWVTANFKETQLAKVHPGQPAEVKVDMNGRVLHGTVDSIAGSTGARMSLLPPENAVGNFVKIVQRIPVKIRVNEQEAQAAGLRPGMNVEATILIR